jgi:hypothetical protein
MMAIEIKVEASIYRSTYFAPSSLSIMESQDLLLLVVLLCPGLLLSVTIMLTFAAGG